MTTTQQHPQERDREQEGQQRRHDVIQSQVMSTLGKPGNLHQVQVRRLWNDHYRVNILIGADAASVRVAHSYFLVADDDGKILACTPQISRQY